MNFVGIDVGLKGAIAFWSPEGIWVEDAPVTGPPRSQFLEANMLTLLEIAASKGECTAAIERAQAYPGRKKGGEQVGGQGVSSALNYGAGWGLWRGMMVALHIPYIVVSPNVWKSAVGAPKGASKDWSRAKAQQLFPAAAARLARKKDDGRADALLIMHWLRQQHIE